MFRVVMWSVQPDYGLLKLSSSMPAVTQQQQLLNKEAMQNKKKQQTKSKIPDLEHTALTEGSFSSPHTTLTPI